MKFETKIKIFIAILIGINLFYLKIASNIRNEVNSIIDYENNDKLKQKETIALLNTNKNSDINLQKDKLFSQLENTNPLGFELIENQSSTNSTQDSCVPVKSNQTGIVEDVGNNINDGLMPMPVSSNKIELVKEGVNTPTKAERSSHLFSFFTILSITLTVAMLIIYINIRQDKRGKLSRLGSSIQNEEGYVLIKE